MSAPVIVIELRPSGELMLALDAVVRSADRLSSAIEASNKIAGPVATDQPAVANTRAPGAGGSAAHTPVPPSPETTRAEPPRKPRKPMSPEHLEKLRQNAAKGRAVAAAKLAVAQIPASAPNVDLSRLSTIGVVVERKAAPVAPIAPAPAPKPPVVAPQPKSRMEALAAVSRAIEAKLPVDPGEPVFAGFEHVRSWAGQRGVPFQTWDDLPAVNSRRERLGLPRFKREFATRGAFG